jgi:hypothetical protein
VIPGSVERACWLQGALKEEKKTRRTCAYLDLPICFKDCLYFRVFFEIFLYGVYELPMQRNSQKRNNQKNRKKTRLCFFCKTFICVLFLKQFVKAKGLPALFFSRGSIVFFEGSGVVLGPYF